MLSELAMRQEEYRVLIEEIEDSDDKSFVEATAVNGFLEEKEALIAVSTIIFELKHRDPDEVNEAVLSDVLWSTEFLDHLDTLGWRLVRK